MRRWLERLRSTSVDHPPPPVATVFDPSDPAFVANPHPFFRHLRDHEPIHRTPAGAWALTRYEHVLAALEDERLGNAPARHAVLHERNRDRYVCADVAANILPFLDSPDHGPARIAVSRAFHRRLRRRPPDISGRAARLLDAWPEEAAYDLVAEYASPLARSVIADVVGISTADMPRLDRWSETFFYLFAPIPSVAVRERLDAGLSEFRTCLRDLVRERSRAPRDDLISDLLHPSNEAALAVDQIVDNLMLLFADGIENVDRAIGNAVATLLEHPDQLERLRDDGELLPSAVAECLRYESPAQYIARTAHRAIDLDGIPIPAGATVLLVLGSANRDDRVFPHADTFDVARAPNPHLAFGRGSHSCVGGSLVEEQMRVALGVLLDGTADLRLVDDPIEWVPRPAHRWVKAVRVRRGR